MFFIEMAEIGFSINSQDDGTYRLVVGDIVTYVQTGREILDCNEVRLVDEWIIRDRFEDMLRYMKDPENDEKIQAEIEESMSTHELGDPDRCLAQWHRLNCEE